MKSISYTSKFKNDFQPVYRSKGQLHNQTIDDQLIFEDYLVLKNRSSSLSALEIEVINLAVSLVNDANHCLVIHTNMIKSMGFSSEETMSIRLGSTKFNEKINALAEFVKDATLGRGIPQKSSLNKLLKAGYNHEHIVDIVMTIGTKTIENYLNCTSSIRSTMMNNTRTQSLAA